MINKEEQEFNFVILEWNSRLAARDLPNLLWLDFKVSTITFNEMQFNKIVESFARRNITVTKISAKQAGTTWIRFKKSDMSKSFREH